MGGCMSDLKGGKQAVDVGSRNRKQEDANDAIGHFLNAHGLQGLFTPLELSFSASKLRNLDVFSKSDPMAVLYAKKRDGLLEELGRTEVIMNSLNPSWIAKFSINYQFETVQPLVIRVFDIDTRYHQIDVKLLKLDEQDFIGEASCTLSEIVTKRNRSLTLNLLQRNMTSGAHSGTVTVHAEEPVASRMAVEIIFRCSNLKNADMFSKSDPFLRISRVVEDGISIPICKTEVIDNNLNPVWKPVILTARQFGSKENPLIVECFDFDADGNHSLLGKLQVSVAELESLSREKTGAHFHLHSSLRPDHKKTLKGQLFVDNFTERTQYTFLDYISSGFELNFLVAIDFTASNGHPMQPASLHFVDPSGHLNSYQQAIVGVGEVLEFYDSDRCFPAWGFGGRINGSISHCFNLSGHPQNYELPGVSCLAICNSVIGMTKSASRRLKVEGIAGIMSAYAMALHNVTLAGPTLFGPVITKAAELASHSLAVATNKYFVLLIITDGVITDLQETKDAIVRASDLPLSILIVGVGGADYKEMEILDADNGRRLESSTGRIATRDIVQFVPIRDVQGGVSIVQLLLEELPGQFLSYMRSQNIEPLFARYAQAAAASAPLLT